MYNAPTDWTKRIWPAGEINVTPGALNLMKYKEPIKKKLNMNAKPTF
jgi:hypothetical protein